MSFLLKLPILFFCVKKFIIQATNESNQNMASKNLDFVPVLMYKKDFFEKKSLFELMQIIWAYSNTHRNKCMLCCHYRSWCIEYLKSKWLPSYIDVEMVVKNLCERNTSWCDLDKIPTTDLAFYQALVEGKNLHSFRS